MWSISWQQQWYVKADRKMMCDTLESIIFQKERGRNVNRQELANRFGVSVGLISRIVKNEIWTHI